MLTREDLESKWKKYYQRKDVRQTVDNLLEAEENWDDFLRNVDEKIDKGVGNGGKPIIVGSMAPLNIPLINIDSERYLLKYFQNIKNLCLSYLLFMSMFLFLV